MLGPETDKIPTYEEDNQVGKRDISTNNDNTVISTKKEDQRVGDWS